MIEQFVVFTRGGVVLYSKVVSRLQGSPMNGFIKSILIEVCIPPTRSFECIVLIQYFM